MSIDFKQVRTCIVQPVLKHLQPVIKHTLAAENLIMGTIAQESSGKYIKQLGSGPAIGLAQMEPATHDDIWNNFLSYNEDLANKVRELELPSWYEDDNAKEMAGNFYYAVAMCRVHYYRRPEALPKAKDVLGLARYWKEHYNTHLGAGHVSEFMQNYKRFVSAS